jgi:DNA-binding IclR family transcriptional regulator
MIHSVLKAIKILNLFSVDKTRLSLNEVSNQLRMPKSTAHNLLNTLLSEGFIEKTDDGLYSLGKKPLVLTQTIRVNVEIRDPAAPLLRELADKTKASVYLTVINGNFALYIYAIESPKRLLARTAVGDQVPLYCTSVGKAMLAFFPAKEFQTYISKQKLQAFTKNTIVDKQDLLLELEKTRMRGFSIDNAEHEENTYCIGAAIMNQKGEVIAACSISGQDPSIVTEKMDELAHEVTFYAQEISRRMGFVPLRTTHIAMHAGS